LFVIQTDGEENSSREYQHALVLEKISHQTEKYKWQFVFLGADIKAMQFASTIGILGKNMQQYQATPQGTSKMYDTISCSTVQYRSNQQRGLNVDEIAAGGFFDATKTHEAVNNI
jgi:hypothetical protein